MSARKIQQQDDELRRSLFPNVKDVVDAALTESTVSGIIEVFVELLEKEEGAEGALSNRLYSRDPSDSVPHPQASYR